MKKTSKHTGQLPLDGVEQSLEDAVVSTERPLGMPALSVIKAEAVRQGLLESDAEHIFDVWLLNGFKLRNGKSMQDWRAAIRIWKRQEYFPSQKQAARTRPTSNKANWKPPSLEEVKAYCSRKRWSVGFARHCYDTWIANNWRHYGEPISTDEQWKAIMGSMDYRP